MCGTYMLFVVTCFLNERKMEWVGKERSKHSHYRTVVRYVVSYRRHIPKKKKKKGEKRTTVDHWDYMENVPFIFWCMQAAFRNDSGPLNHCRLPYYMMI